MVLYKGRHCAPFTLIQHSYRGGCVSLAQREDGWRLYMSKKRNSTVPKSPNTGRFSPYQHNKLYFGFFQTIDRKIRDQVKEENGRFFIVLNNEK